MPDIAAECETHFRRSFHERRKTGQIPLTPAPIPDIAAEGELHLPPLLTCSNVPRRRARIDPPRIPQHIAQHGNSRGVCFFIDNDRCTHFDRLVTSKVTADLHAFCRQSASPHACPDAQAHWKL